MAGRYSRAVKDDGEVRIVTIPDSVGVDWIYEVPAGQIVRVDSIYYLMDLDAAGATRYPMFVYWNPAMGNIDIVRKRYPNHAPGTDRQFSLYTGCADIGQTVRGSVTAPNVGVLVDDLPDMKLQPGLRLGPATSGLNVADVFRDIRLVLTVWRT